MADERWEGWDAESPEMVLTVLPRRGLLAMACPRRAGMLENEGVGQWKSGIGVSIVCSCLGVRPAAGKTTRAFTVPLMSHDDNLYN